MVQTEVYLKIIIYKHKTCIVQAPGLICLPEILPGFTHKHYRILSIIVHTCLQGNDAQIFPAHYTWKVAEKGLKMASMMNKLATIHSCYIILEK